jgi:hypothetical protein
MRIIRLMNRVFSAIHRHLSVLLIVILIIFNTGCTEEVAKAIIVRGYMEELVKRWAPIHTQDVDQDGEWSLSGRSDFITAVDFDGDWNTANNWENIPARFGYKAVAHGYYSIVLTETHAFIIYAFYHPRDWDTSGFKPGAHENDMEGLLEIIELPGRLGSDDFPYSEHGALKAIVTVYHCDFISYNNRELPETERYQQNDESIDGNIRFMSFSGVDHPRTAQEANGHGLKAWPDVQIEGDDGIVYYPTFGTASEPAGPNDRNAQYMLVDIFQEEGLWERDLCLFRNLLWRYARRERSPCTLEMG